MGNSDEKPLNTLLLAGVTALALILTWLVTSSPWGYAAIAAVVPGAAIPDTTFFYSASGFYAMLERLGTEGLRRYMVMNFVDLFYPAAYGLCFVVWLERLRPRGNAIFRLIPLLGFIPVVFDLTENTLTRILTYSLPERFNLAGDVLGFASAFKASTFALVLAAIASLAIAKTFNRFFKSRR